MCCCAATALAREEYRRDFRKTVTLTGGRSFRVENSNGNITINTQGKGEAQIQATIRSSADTAAEARSFGEQIEIIVDEGGSGVSVRTRYPSSYGGNRGYSVDYDIVIPENSPLEVRNRFGAVNVSNVHAAGTINNANGRVSLTGGRGRQQIENSFGDVEVRTNDGDLTVRNGNGAVIAADITGIVDITNRFGRIRATNVGHGLTIHSNNGEIDAQNVGGVTLISNSFGRVTVTDMKSDVTVQNQNGQVRATGVTGTADLHTTFDRVDVSHIGKALRVRAANATVVGDAVGESATVETTFGSVELRDVKTGARVTSANSSVRLTGIGGEAYAKTSFGGVDVNDVSGPVTVENQNGSVTVASRPGQRCQPISVQTSFGPIRVSLPSGMGYNVTARTSFGRIHSDEDMTVSGDFRPDSMSGKIAGGGCDLRLTGQNGSIDILKSPGR